MTVREAVANLLDNKADELNMQIDSKLKDLDLIKDIEDRAIQELLLDETYLSAKIICKTACKQPQNKFVKTMKKPKRLKRTEKRSHL